MATATLAPSPNWQPLDDDGQIVPLGQLFFYLTGTLTPVTVYQDAAMGSSHAQPVVLDAAGRATIYLPASSVKVVFKSAVADGSATIWTADPVASTALVQSGLGELYTLGGDPNSPITVTSYPSGTGGDKIHPGSRTVSIDSAVLASGGTFKLSAMLKGETAGTITLALVNLTDGAPDTPLVTISNSSTTGIRQQSAAITFPAGGAAKDYAIKSLVNAGAGYAWAATLERTA